MYQQYCTYICTQEMWFALTMVRRPFLGMKFASYAAHHAQHPKQEITLTMTEGPHTPKARLEPTPVALRR